MTEHIIPENDAPCKAVADALARHFKPDEVRYPGPNSRGRYDQHREADGRDSTMIVFRAADGHNAMRALTFAEIAEALDALGLLASRDIPPALTEDSFCRACSHLLSGPPPAGCIHPEWHTPIPPGLPTPPTVATEGAGGSDV